MSETDKPIYQEDVVGELNSLIQEAQESLRFSEMLLRNYPHMSEYSKEIERESVIRVRRALQIRKHILSKFQEA